MAERDRVHVYLDAVGEWRWKRTAGNHRIIADSGEGYRHRADCLDAMTAVNQNPYLLIIETADDDRVELDLTGQDIVYRPPAATPDKEAEQP